MPPSRLRRLPVFDEVPEALTQVGEGKVLGKAVVSMP